MDYEGQGAQSWDQWLANCPTELCVDLLMPPLLSMKAGFFDAKCWTWLCFVSEEYWVECGEKRCCVLWTGPQPAAVNALEPN